MLRLGLEVRVGSPKVMIGVELKEQLPIFVDLSNSEMAQERGPRVTVCAHGGRVVFQENKLVLPGDVSDDCCYVFIEFALSLSCGA